MKVEIVDVLCILIAIFFLAAYFKVGQIAFLLGAIVLVAPVVYFMFRGSLKIKVAEEKKHAQ